MPRHFDSTALDQELYRRSKRPTNNRNGPLFRIDRPTIISLKPGMAMYLYYYMLEELTRIFGLNQIVIGIGLLICTLLKYGIYSRDPHASLAYALSSLSMGSQTCALLSLISSDVPVTDLQLWLPLPYSIVLVICLGKGYKRRDDKLGFTAAVYSLVFIYCTIGLAAGKALVKIMMPPKPMASRKSSSFARSRVLRLLKFAAACAIAVESLAIYLAEILHLKYDPAWIPGSSGCNMNTAAENEWTLGQIYAVIMLVVLLLPLKDVYDSTMLHCQ